MPQSLGLSTVLNKTYISLPQTHLSEFGSHSSWDKINKKNRRNNKNKTIKLINLAVHVSLLGKCVGVFLMALNEKGYKLCKDHILL